MLLIIRTDGASHGNPGPAAIGAVIKNEQGQVIATISQAIGRATNNQAEYRAVIAALEKALSLGATDVFIQTDSELLELQIKGEYRVRDATLKQLNLKVKELLSRFHGFGITHIPGEDNEVAHNLASRALKRRLVP
ncbi:MAG: ribonuclease HI family protein [Chloroflexi bacterium]|nr:ribonuclease HI family protein [Chloroflexota bacterium]